MKPGQRVGREELLAAAAGTPADASAGASAIEHRAIHIVISKSIGEHSRGILKLLTDTDNRCAEFRSVIGYCAPNSEPKIFLGKVSGEIAVEERGNLGFAFDPIFYVPSEDKTFGELTTDEKNRFSHRKNSLEKYFLRF